MSSSSSHRTKKPRFSLRNPSTLAANTSDSEDSTAADPILSADVIPSTRTHKRNAVNIDGFSSDSDADNFDRRASKKARDEKLQRSREEEENDMFAELKDDLEGEKPDDDSDEDAGAKKKKKNVKFVTKDAISGQDLTSKSGGHVSSRINLTSKSSNKGKSKANPRRRERSASFSSISSAHSQSSASSTSISDSERARADSVDAELGAGSKKTHAPLLDAFNMRSEQSDGAFDEFGNYVRKSGDPDAVHDVWMEGVSKKEMRRAREAMEKRERERRKKEIADKAASVAETLKTLISLLEKGETVLEALARLGNSKKKAQSKTKTKQKPKWQTKQKTPKPTDEQAANGTTHKHTHTTNGHDHDTTMNDTSDDANDTPQTPQDPEISRITHQIELLTSAADLLLTKGQSKNASKIYTDIYDTEREMLIRQYTRETGEQWVDPPSRSENQEDDEEPAVKESGWQYRWTDARDGGTINGPYDSNTMRSWCEAGYFGEGVEFRQVGSSEWSRVPDF